MTPRTLLIAAATAVVLAASGGCDGLPGSAPTQLPALPTTLPTQLPDGLPTQLPDGLPTTLPTQLPEGLPTTLPTELPTALPGLPGGDATPEQTLGAAPEATVPSAVASEEPGLVDEVVEGTPWWVWALLVLLVVVLVAAVVALRRARAAELRWAALWHDLTGEARWLDERVVPAVQDRSLDVGTLTTRWQEGQHRFDDLDRRIWTARNEEQRPRKVADLDALTEVLQRLRDAVDTEVALRSSDVEQPGLQDAAQTVADARDDLRRTVTERTR